MKKRGLFWVGGFGVLFVGVASLWLHRAESASPSRVHFTVMISMRDGVKLATDVSLPYNSGKFSTILTRTPYGRKEQGKGLERFVLAGYASVVQDVRGRFDSEGKALAFLDDAQDGYETVEWIARQEWSDGKVCTTGGSAMGMTQNMLAPTQPPHLVCQFVLVAPASLYHHAAYVGGVLRKEQVENWLTQHHFPPENFELYQSHPYYDDFWEKTNPVAKASQVNVPITYVGGWFDTFLQGTIDMFMKVQHEGGSGARGKAKLIVGPWTHGGLGERKQGELLFPESAVRPPAGDPLRWFDYWLKGGSLDSNPELPVIYYVVGDVDNPRAPGNEWRRAKDWPPPSIPTPFYFRSDGSLSLVKPSQESPRSYTYDPESPVPTIGGRNLTIPKGPFDQREIENRPDVLVYSTEPLKESVEVTGRIFAHLYVSTTATDSDFVVRLSDVYPDGRSMLMADGILRGSLRNSFEKPEKMEAGKVYELTVDLWSISIIFHKGHRIRVAISPSNYPRWEKNPLPAVHTIYHDSAHPSSILLPVIEKK